MLNFEYYIDILREKWYNGIRISICYGRNKYQTQINLKQIELSAYQILQTEYLLQIKFIYER